MALAALIAAYHDAAAPDAGLRATLPLAGRTLVERQARLAVQAGAESVIVLVERMSGELAAAIDRVRAEGVPLRVARSAREAADKVKPDDRLLLVGDGLLADPAAFARVADAAGPAVLTLPDAGLDERYERIDAEARWAGLAAADGAMLGETAAMLGDWDLQSTLLRRTVQAGARQIALRPEREGGLVIATGAADLVAVEQNLVGTAAAGVRGWVSRFFLAPVERLLTLLLLPTALTPAWVRVAAAALVGLGGISFTRGWLWTGLALLLLATPLDGVAARLASVRLTPAGAPGWWSSLLPALAGAALVALAHSLSPALGWGCSVLAAATILFVLAQHTELAAAPSGAADWIAERKGLTWLMLPFAIAGQWHYGLAALAAYAAGSFFWVQRQAHRPPARA